MTRYILAALLLTTCSCRALWLFDTSLLEIYYAEDRAVLVAAHPEWSPADRGHVLRGRIVVGLDASVADAAMNGTEYRTNVVVGPWGTVRERNYHIRRWLIYLGDDNRVIMATTY